ncbi:hypothetical protein TNCV_1439961 [Trichonephila clavipes]|nr:hypothetical protein TNCV_1439961 [Trichonephila clavipes]
MTTQATHLQNQTGKKRISFASRRCKTALQCKNTEYHLKNAIHCGSTTFLLPRYDTVKLLVVPKIEGDGERSTFFNTFRSSDSRAHMDTRPTRIFLHRWNKEMDGTSEQMCSC